MCIRDRVTAVIAGPGTGKTKTLVSRIEHLMGERGVKPSEITAVTFTNKAADELTPVSYTHLTLVEQLLERLIKINSADIAQELGVET